MCYMLFAIRKDNKRRFKRTRAGPGIDMGRSNREGLSPMNIVFAYYKKDEDYKNDYRNNHTITKQTLLRTLASLCVTSQSASW